MFLLTSTYTDLVSAYAEVQGRLEELARTNAAQHANIEWLKLRINQLETERAVLLKQATGVEFPIATIETAPPAAPAQSPLELAIFEDPGDIEAAKMGVFHGPNGELDYRKPKS